jgi:hypothetical protein
MATGWPMKTTYANGDVFSASDVNDITGTINLLTSSTLSRAAGKNSVINGGMDIWARGTSFAVSTGTYTADRWQGYRAVAGSTITRQVTGDTTNLPNIQYCARVSRDSGNTSTAAINLGQSLESVNSIPMAGQTVTLSFYARRGANYSSASNALKVQLYAGTGTDQNVLTAGYTGSTLGIDQTATLTTTWQRFSYSVTIGVTYTELGVIFVNTPVGTAGAADYFEVTGVQLELGSTATTFSRAGGTIQGELAACQRYFQVIASGDGLLVSGGSPITTSGNITIVNTGVTRLSAGTGISLSGSNGSVTVSATTTGGTSPRRRLRTRWPGNNLRKSHSYSSSSGFSKSPRSLPCTNQT